MSIEAILFKIKKLLVEWCGQLIFWDYGSDVVVSQR